MVLTVYTVFRPKSPQNCPSLRPKTKLPLEKQAKNDRILVLTCLISAGYFSNMYRKIILIPSPIARKWLPLCFNCLRFLNKKLFFFENKNIQKKYEMYIEKYHSLFIYFYFRIKIIFYSKIEDSKVIHEIISERLVKELNQFIYTR